MSYEPSKTSSTTSSSITFPVSTTRRRTNSPRSRRGESPPPPQRLCTGRRKTVRQPRADTLEPRGALRGSLKPSRC
jgi:hypothetical protein